MSPVYPTRSFLVWAVASALSTLGFNVDASSVPVVTEHQYKSIFNNEVDMRVYFVGASVGKTD